MSECKILCRLCLGSWDDSQPLEGFISYKLKFLVPTIDLDLSSSPRICHECYRELVVHYRFKSKCLDNNEPMHNFEKLELMAKSYIPQSFYTENEKQTQCGLCHCKNIPRWFAANQGKLLQVMLDTCLPDLDDMVSITCKKCLEGLKGIFRFVNACLHTEEKIKKYCYFNDLDCKNEVDLNDVLQFVNNKTEDYIVSHQDDDVEDTVAPSVESHDVSIKAEPDCEATVEKNGNSNVGTESDAGIDIEDGPGREEIENYGKQLQGNYDQPVYAVKKSIERSQSGGSNVTVKTYICMSCKYSTKHKSRFYRHKQLYHKYLSHEKARYTCRS